MRNDIGEGEDCGADAAEVGNNNIGINHFLILFSSNILDTVTMLWATLVWMENVSLLYKNHLKSHRPSLKYNSSVLINQNFEYKGFFSDFAEIPLYDDNNMRMAITCPT